MSLLLIQSLKPSMWIFFINLVILLFLYYSQSRFRTLCSTVLVPSPLFPPVSHLGLGPIDVFIQCILDSWPEIEKCGDEEKDAASSVLSNFHAIGKLKKTLFFLACFGGALHRKTYLPTWLT